MPHAPASLVVALKLWWANDMVVYQGAVAPVIRSQHPRVTLPCLSITVMTNKLAPPFASPSRWKIEPQFANRGQFISRMLFRHLWLDSTLSLILPTHQALRTVETASQLARRLDHLALEDSKSHDSLTIFGLHPS